MQINSTRRRFFGLMGGGAIATKVAADAEIAKVAGVDVSGFGAGGLGMPGGSGQDSRSASTQLSAPNRADAQISLDHARSRYGEEASWIRVALVITIGLITSTTAMTVKEQLEMIAKDCEECARDSQARHDKGEERAWFSVAYRIRFAARRLENEEQTR